MLPPVESELFTTLQGEWTATMTGRVGGMGGGIEVSFPVTIAAGADEQTAADYRAQNRLVCLGFDYDGALSVFYSGGSYGRKSSGYGVVQSLGGE